MARNRFYCAALVGALGLMAGNLYAQSSFDPGLGVSDRIPGFALRDQDNRRQTFDSLKGRAGLVLQFFRSADW